MFLEVGANSRQAYIDNVSYISFFLGMYRGAFQPVPAGPDEVEVEDYSDEEVSNFIFLVI